MKYGYKRVFTADFQLVECLLNHPPFIVSLFQHDGAKGKHFKFFNMWADHADFKNQVATNWNQQIQGTKQFILCKKLQRLNRILSNSIKGNLDTFRPGWTG